GRAREPGVPGHPPPLQNAGYQTTYRHGCPDRHPSPERHQVHPEDLMTKILITGGMGVIGAKLVANFRAKGHDVWAADRGHHFDPKYMRADIGEYRQVENLIRKVQPELVYHTAAEFGRWNGEAYYENLWKANVVGTKHVLMLQKEHGFKLVHFSSSEVYGDY